MAPKITTLQTSPAQISNQEFLTEVFGSKVWGRSHVCAFPEDPTKLDKLGKRHYWAGGEARVLVPGMADTDNTFFTISTFNPDPASGKSKRRKVLFEKSYVITIDDVGLRGLADTSAKVPAEKIMLDPSYALETSPGNWQVGYLVKQASGNGDDRGGKVAGLLEAMVAQGLVSDGSDPGMKGVTRYIRLPVGTNTKEKYGTGGFKHVLGTWKPELRYTLEQIADAYGVRTEFDNYDPTLGVKAMGVVDPDNDDIAKVLVAAGQVVSWDEVKKLWHVICPFVDEHSKREESGTAYLGNGAWNCCHGHCEDRPSIEFNDKIMNDHPKEWAEAMKDPDLGTVGNGAPESVAPSAGTRQEAKDMADDFGIPVEAAEKTISDNKNPFIKDAAKTKAGRWSHLEHKTPPAPDFVVPGYFPRGLISSLYGVDGIGKNMLVQRACMNAITKGEFFGQPIGEGFKAAFMGVEDVDAAIMDRAKRIGTELGLTGPDWAKLDNQFVMPDLIDQDAKMMNWSPAGDKAYTKFTKNLGEFVGDWHPDLLVLDPISDLYEDEESNRQRVVGFMRMLGQMAQKFGISVLLLGHPARSEGSEYSGSGAWSSKARARTFLTRDEDDDKITWLQHRKVSYGPLMADRMCRWTGTGVLVDEVSNLGASAGGVTIIGEVAGHLRDLSVAGEVCSARSTANNNVGKVFKRHGFMPGVSDKKINRAVMDAIKDGFLAGNIAFDGSATAPVIQNSNRTYKIGVWFA